jgi:hypothetical protein
MPEQIFQLLLTSLATVRPTLTSWRRYRCYPDLTERSACQHLRQIAYEEAGSKYKSISLQRRLLTFVTYPKLQIEANLIASSGSSRWRQYVCNLITQGVHKKMVQLHTNYDDYILQLDGAPTPWFSQEFTSVSQFCSSTTPDRTCCKRRQPNSPLVTPFAGPNTMQFLSLGVR